MPYIALKPCEFGGKKYIVGELVPDELVAKPKKLVDAKVIAPQKGTISGPVETTDRFTFPVLSDGVVTSVETTAENLFEALIIIQKVSDDAIEHINECDNADVLFMVDTLESRKGVQSAIDKRIKALQAEEPTEETSEEPDEATEEQGEE